MNREEAMAKEAREQLIRAAWEGALKDFTYEPEFMAVLKREYLRIEALFGQKGGPNHVD